MECPKCKGEMEEGYVNTRIDVWKGKINDFPPIQEPLNLRVVYACKECGYLEFYTKEQD